MTIHAHWEFSSLMLFACSCRKYYEPGKAIVTSRAVFLFCLYWQWGGTVTESVPLQTEPQGRGLEHFPLGIGTPLATSSAANQRNNSYEHSYPQRSPCWFTSFIRKSFWEGPSTPLFSVLLNTIRLKGCLKGWMATTPTSHREMAQHSHTQNKGIGPSGRAKGGKWDSPSNSCCSLSMWQFGRQVTIRPNQEENVGCLLLFLLKRTKTQTQSSFKLKQGPMRFYNSRVVWTPGVNID